LSKIKGLDILKIRRIKNIKKWFFEIESILKIKKQTKKIKINLGEDLTGKPPKKFKLFDGNKIIPINTKREKTRFLLIYLKILVFFTFNNARL
tara:strand:+ start:85 stop:363 length:279 start_codon:yes stop_codon:yes gene_type:complete